MANKQKRAMLINWLAPRYQKGTDEKPKEDPPSKSRINPYFLFLILLLLLKSTGELPGAILRAFGLRQ